MFGEIYSIDQLDPMEKKNIKRHLVIGILSVLLLMLGVFLNTMKERYSMPDVFTAHRSAQSGFTSFYSKVVPILDKYCSVCHGVGKEKYLNIKNSALSSDLLRWQVDPTGRIGSIQLGQQLFSDLFPENNKSDLVDYDIHPIESHLLRAGLAKIYSGSIHHEIFNSPNDKDFQDLREWIESVHISKAAVEKSESETFFSEKVVPVLVRKNCFGCHGPMAFNDLRLDPGIPMLDEQFTSGIDRYNRKAMLGESVRMVNLSGDVERSKQLLKNIPIEQGGIVHLGGNNFLNKNDPDYNIFLQWLELEKEEVQQKVGMKLGLMNGIVYVQRPEATPERFFEDDTFHPGGDIFWFKDDKKMDLTSSLHPEGPADLRAPDVSYDAKKILFSMRKSEREPFNIWELELANGTARQITFSEDPEIHFKDPLYIPHPEAPKAYDLSQVAIAFVSNLNGEYCQSSPNAILGEAESGSLDRIFDHQRKEKAGTFDRRTITIVRGANKGEVRKIMSYTSGEIRVNRPFSMPCNSTTHYEISSEARMAPKYDAYRMHLAEKGNERKVFRENLTRMSYSVSQIRRPTMRSDGEIMFTALRTGYQEGREFFNGALFRTHVDGSNLHTHNGNRSGIPILEDDREMPNGLEVRIGRDADSYWGGMLILSDHQFGPSIENYNPTDNLDHPYQKGMPENSKVKFVPGWVSLDTLVGYGGVSLGGAYLNPYPLPDGSILVSYAKGPIDLHDPNADPDFNIIKISPDPAFQSVDGFNFGSAKREVVISGEGSQLWPRPVTPRLKEGVHKKLKNDPELFGIPEMINGFTQYPENVAASLQVSDLILLEVFFEQATPVGNKNIASSEVKYARVIGAQPQYKGDSGPVKRFIIAEVPVEEDGSFYVQVPSKVSFDIQSLNSDKMAIRSPNRWLYCQPGEKHSLSTPRNLFAQACGGCHGGLTGSKEDVLRRPDAITGASRTMSSWDKEHQKVLLPSNYSGNKKLATQFITYDMHIEPIIQKKCISCHSGGNNRTNIDLSEGKGFVALSRFVEYKEALAIKSDLIEILTGKEFLAPHQNQNDLPHPAGNPLNEEEILAIIRWIDLGAIQQKGGKIDD